MALVRAIGEANIFALNNNINFCIFPPTHIGVMSSRVRRVLGMTVGVGVGATTISMFFLFSKTVS
jgi:hypothetical protein